MENVKRYLFRHPFKVINMEIRNSFLTSKRVLFGRSQRGEIYPKLFFEQKYPITKQMNNIGEM